MPVDTSRQTQNYLMEQLDAIADLKKAIDRVRTARALYDLRGYATSGDITDEIFAQVNYAHLDVAGFTELMTKLDAIWSDQLMTAAMPAICKSLK